MPPLWQDMVLVGRVARSHGNRGAVIVDPETDFPEERFRPGAIVYVNTNGRVEPKTIVSAGFRKGRPIIAFEGIETIDGAENLASTELRVPENEIERLPQGSYYRHDLIGCEVSTTGGRIVGRVSRVDGPQSGSRLVVGETGSEVLIPLAAEICVEVDLAAKRIVIDPPEGLLDLNAR